MLHKHKLSSFRIHSFNLISATMSHSSRVHVFVCAYSSSLLYFSAYFCFVHSTNLSLAGLSCHSLRYLRLTSIRRCGRNIDSKCTLRNVRFANPFFFGETIFFGYTKRITGRCLHHPSEWMLPSAWNIFL